MSLKSAERQFKEACEAAKLEINGDATHDPKLSDARAFYHRFAKNPLLALGDSYVLGEYDVEDLGEMMLRLSQTAVEGRLPKMTPRQKANMIMYQAFRRFRNPNKRRKGQKRIAERHYDYDNDLMRTMLGEETMKYTSGFWLPEYGPFELDTAQKLCWEVAGRRMGLQEGMKVGDCGYGYGPATKYFVERFGVEIIGITISAEQQKYAEQVCADISDRVRFILSDWRDLQETGELDGQLDAMMSFEMIESIGGPKNYPDFFRFQSDTVKEDGVVLMQAINTKNLNYGTNPWIDKVIFPNGVLPTPGSLIRAAEQAGLYFRFADNNMGHMNGLTCEAWANNLRNGWEDLTKNLRNPEGHQTMHLGEISPWLFLGGVFSSEIRQIIIDQCAPVGTKRTVFRDRLAHVYPRDKTSALSMIRNAIIAPCKSAEAAFKSDGSDEKIAYRTWQYYLQSCAGGHKVGYMDDGQFVFMKDPTDKRQPRDVEIPRTKAEVNEFLN